MLSKRFFLRNWRCSIVSLKHSATHRLFINQRNASKTLQWPALWRPSGRNTRWDSTSPGRLLAAASSFVNNGVNCTQKISKNQRQNAVCILRGFATVFQNMFSFFLELFIRNLKPVQKPVRAKKSPFLPWPGLPWAKKATTSSSSQRQPQRSSSFSKGSLHQAKGARLTGRVVYIYISLSTGWCSFPVLKCSSPKNSRHMMKTSASKHHF